MTQKGFDGLTAWPNGITHRKLARVGFEVKGDPFEAFVNGQKAYPFQVGLEIQNSLNFYGENGEVEYGGSFKNVDKSHESQKIGRKNITRAWVLIKSWRLVMKWELYQIKNLRWVF